MTDILDEGILKPTVGDVALLVQKITVESNLHKDPEAAVGVTTEMYELLCRKILLKNL